MEKRFVVFIVLCVVTVLGWGYLSNRWMPKPVQPPAALNQSTQSAPGQMPSSAGAQPALKPSSPAASKASKPLAEKRLVASTDKIRVEFTNQGAQVSSWTVLAYREHQKDPRPVELVPGGAVQPGAMAVTPAYGALDLPGTDLANRAWEIETAQVEPDAQGQQTVSFSTALPEQGVRLRKTFTLSQGRFLVDLKVEIIALGTQAANLKDLALQWGPGLGQVNLGDRSNMLSAATLGDKLERLGISNTDERHVVGGRPKWTALTNHYFALALIPQEGPWDSTQVLRLAKSLTTGLVSSVSVQPGKTVELKAQLFGGPKEYSLLKSLGINLQKLVNFGWFEIFAVWMLYVLKWFYALTHNYGLAIILLTVVVKAVVWFPTHKSMTSMRHMQKAQAQMAPRLETLKKVYKDDKQKLNAETMKLYKEYNVNPIAGCLPMLLQMPILFALYSCLNGAFELRGAGFLWVWTDLSVKDPTWILPLAMGATMFLQQKMTPTPANASPEVAQQQKMMQYMMPVMLTGMAIWTGWPAGLLLYWTSSNLLSIVQQSYINKTVPA